MIFSWWILCKFSFFFLYCYGTENNCLKTHILASAKQGKRASCYNCKRRLSNNEFEYLLDETEHQQYEQGIRTTFNV